MNASIPLLLVALTATAAADADVGVVVTGDPTIQPQLAAEIEGWLRTRGHDLAPSPLPSDALTTLIDCTVIEDLSCAGKVVEDRATTTDVVFAKAKLGESSDGKREITITAYWFERERPATTVRRTCEACTGDRLRAITRELMTALAGSSRAEVGQAALTTTPPGARVRIDGVDVGVTPLTKALPSGAHKVEVSHADAGRAERIVEVRRGERADVDFVLAARPSRVLPISLLSGGGALVVIGIVLLAIDEDDTGETFEYRDTGPFGATLGCAGLAVAGVGAYLLFRDRSPESRPQVAIVPGGAVLGWGRSF